MKQLLIAASLLALATPPVFAADSAAKSDSGFVEKMARDNQTEIELGQLAQQKATSPEVKSLGQRVATDHEKANQQLMSIAQSENITMPKKLDREERAERSKLEKLDGAAFDQAFVQGQIRDHQRDIKYLQKESDNVKNAQLKSYIQQALPEMQQHLQLAQQAEGQLSGSGSSTPRANGSRSDGSSSKY